MTIETLEELFLYELSDTYNSEKQIAKVLPKLAKAATDQLLVDALQTNLKETEEQIIRIEKVAELCNLKLTQKKCTGMEGIINEGLLVIEKMAKGTIRDMGLVSASQKIEHYEISAYLHLMKLAKRMGNRKAFKLLDATLFEEEVADEKLSDVCDQEWAKLLRAQASV